MRHVTRLRKRKPFDLRNTLEEWLNDTILRLVIATVDEQDGDIDLAQSIRDRPSFE